MHLPTFMKRVATTSLVVFATVSLASANELANPGMEDGPPGPGVQDWITFANVFTEAANPPQFEPLSGNQLAVLFGPFDGSVVSGMFQEFPTAEGAEWQMSSNARHWSGDAVIGDNFVVQKIVFKDAADVEIGAVESTILDPSFATDMWHAAAPIVGVAPAGTVQVEAFILFVQLGFDPGAVQIDDVELVDLSAVPVQPATWSRLKAQYGR